MSRFGPSHAGPSLNPVGSALNPVGSSLNPVGSSNGQIGVLVPAGTSPIVAEALRLSRAALSNDDDLGMRDKPLLDSLPAGSPLLRWDMAVRADVCRFELLSQLRFAQGKVWHVPEGADPMPAAVKIIEFVPPPGGWKRIVKAQVPMVIACIEERDERLPEILVQDAGLWPFWVAITNIAVQRMPRTVELVELALGLASTVVLRVKHELACPRPMDVSASVQAVIDTPGHASFPSGHATAAYTFATLAARLLQLAPDDPMAVQLRRLAFRIAENRVVAGVHFPMDGVAGRLLGEALAGYFVSVCTGEPQPLKEAKFEMVANPALLELPEDEDVALSAEVGCTRPAEHQLGVNPILQTMWKAAEAELQRFGFVV